MVGYPPPLAELVKRGKMHFPRRKSACVTTATIEDWVSHPRETPIVPSQLNHREHSIVQGIWVAGASSQHRGSSAFVFAELALVHNLLAHARVTNWKPKWGGVTWLNLSCWYPLSSELGLRKHPEQTHAGMLPAQHWWLGETGLKHLMCGGYIIPSWLAGDVEVKQLSEYHYEGLLDLNPYSFSFSALTCGIEVFSLSI